MSFTSIECCRGLWILASPPAQSVSRDQARVGAGGAYSTGLFSAAEDSYVLVAACCATSHELTRDGAGGARTHGSSAALNKQKYAKICPRIRGCSIPQPSSSGVARWAILVRVKRQMCSL